MPPITITTSAGIRIASPMPICTALIGAISAPASAASAAPSANTKANTPPTRTPMCSAICRFEAPARTSMPTRVLFTSR